MFARTNMMNEDEGWSGLPTLLLWTIKARLDYPHSLYFASVCKHWRHAFDSYPLHFKDESEVENSPPWLMFYESNKTNIMDSKRKFYSFLTGECYTIDNPDFCCSEVLYSKQGWLLLLKRHNKIGAEMCSCLDIDYGSPYFLLNPFKNKKISLPLIYDKVKDAAFNIEDGDPHCIVLVSVNRDETGIIINITHPGDNVWSSYSYKYTGYEYLHNVPWIYFIGKSIYLITDTVQVIAFNLVNLQWTELVMESFQCSNIHPFQPLFVMKKQGEIMRIEFPEGLNDVEEDFRTGNCYKLIIGSEKTYWEKIDSQALENSCYWFLTESVGQSFVFKINEEHESFKLDKAFRKIEHRPEIKSDRMIALRRLDPSKWIHMG